MLLYRASRPHIAVLGRLDGAHTAYVDQERHPDAVPVPGLLLLRLDAPLYFFNVNVARSAILAAVTASSPRPTAVVLDIGSTADFDVTTGDTVRQLIGDLHDLSVDVALARVKGSVRDRMRVMGLMDVVGEDHVYLTMGAAVDDCRRRSMEAAEPGA
jgi:SulP family sulfate permease